MDHSSWNFGNTSMFVDCLMFSYLLPHIQDTFTKTWDKTDWNRTVLGVPVGQKDPRFSSSPSIVFNPSSQEDELCRNDREKQDQQDDLPAHIF